MNRSDFTAIVACALTFSYWNTAARGSLVPGVPVFFALFCLACLFAGRPIARLLGQAAAADFPTAFLLGFLLLNSTLYLLVWLSSQPITQNALYLLAAVIVGDALLTVMGRRFPGHRAGSLGAPSTRDTEGASPAPVSNGSMTSVLAVLISLVAATWWSWDSITPEFLFREGYLYKPFTDSYFHACEICMFRDARGPGTLHDLRMAGEPVWVYHHATYLASALASAATGTTPLLIFASFLVPFGVFLSGIAAFAWIRSLWGGGAGLAALAVLLLMPDASSYGLSNHWLSYHWLQQINPGGYYGVAVLAAAWMLMFAGCRERRLGLVLLGFVTASLSVHYKAHVFVASALLIWIYPGLFFRGVRWRWKVAWLGFAISSFLVAVRLSAGIEAVPLMEFDWSSLKHYMNFTWAWSERSTTRRAMAALFNPTSSFPHDLMWGAILLFYGSLGLTGLAAILPGPLLLVRRLLGWPGRVEAEYVLFPWLIIANYLVMALGFAYDSRSPAHSEELRHRPLVWAYYVAAVWSGGLIYRLVLDEPVRRYARFRRALGVVLIGLLAVPYQLGPDVQAPSDWCRSFTFRSYPRGLYESARYVVENARTGDIVQDSEDDSQLFFSALCEHPAYAIAYFEGKTIPVLAGRVQEMREFRSLTDEEAIRRFAQQRRIRWYVLQPKSKVKWPDTLINTAVFCWNGFRVFSFPAAD